MAYITKRDNKYFVVDSTGEKECKIDHVRGKLNIPENESGRRFVQMALVDNSPEKYVLEPNTKKTWLDYLTEEERVTYDNLRKTAESRMPKPKNLTPLEKAQRQKEKLEEKIKKLLEELQ